MGNYDINISNMKQEDMARHCVTPITLCTYLLTQFIVKVIILDWQIVSKKPIGSTWTSILITLQIQQ